MRHAVIGGTMDDRLVGADGIEIQDGGRARRTKSGRAPGPRRRSRAIRASWEALSKPCSSMSMTRTAGPSASSATNSTSKASDARAPSSMSHAGPRSTRDLRSGSASSSDRAGAPPSDSRSRPRNAASGRVSARRLRQPCLAATQRAGDVGQRTDAAELEPLAAPRPGKIEGNLAFGGRPQAIAPGRPRSAVGRDQDCSPKGSHLLHREGRDRASRPFQHRLMGSQSGPQDFQIALQHSRDLREAEAQGTQRNDVGGAGHLGGAIGAPPDRTTDRRDEAALLVDPQSLGQRCRAAGRPRTGSGIRSSRSQFTSLSLTAAL